MSREEFTTEGDCRPIVPFFKKTEFWFGVAVGAIAALSIGWMVGIVAF